MNHPYRLLVPAMLMVASALPLTAADSAGADFGIQPVALGAGARALGMGGAFSAVADDATAVTWNPAGLTQCERPEASVSCGWYQSEAQTQDGASPSSQALRLDHASGLLPFFALGCQQVVGIAWQRQFDFSRSRQWRQDFVDIPNDFATHATESHKSAGAFSSLGLSYAIEIQPGLSCGLTINRWDDAATSASHYHTSVESQTSISFGGITSAQHYDISAETRVESGTNWILGAFWQATPALTLTVVAKPSYHLHLKRSAQIHGMNDDGFGNVTPDNYVTTTTADLIHPSSLTLGTAWRQDDVHTFSCDATVTRWSQYTVDDDTNNVSPVNGHLASYSFADLWTLRFGYEYVAILPRVIVVPRLGLLLEDLPAATKAPSLGLADQVNATHDRWWGATAGLSICQRRWIWDLGIQVRYGNNVGAGQFAPADQTVDLLVTTARLGLTVQF